MTLILTAVHVLVCLFLIFVVLLQSAQAADLAGAFGGGGTQTALGMRGATTLLQKATTTAAVVFMLTSLALGMTGRQQSSLIEGLDEAPAATAPAEPGDVGAAPGSDSEPDEDGEAASGDGTTGEQSLDPEEGSTQGDAGEGQQQ